jgi:hypothetical protein
VDFVFVAVADAWGGGGGGGESLAINGTRANFGQFFMNEAKQATAIDTATYSEHHHKSQSWQGR